jgi:hypothetical protein
VSDLTLWLRSYLPSSEPESPKNRLFFIFCTSKPKSEIRFLLGRTGVGKVAQSTIAFTRNTRINSCVLIFCQPDNDLMSTPTIDLFISLAHKKRSPEIGQNEVTDVWKRGNHGFQRMLEQILQHKKNSSIL